MFESLQLENILGQNMKGTELQKDGIQGIPDTEEQIIQIEEYFVKITWKIFIINSSKNDGLAHYFLNS